MTYTQTINLDLNSNNAYPTVNAKQSDVDSRIIHVNYTANGEPYIVDYNNSVALRVRKPDNHLVLINGTINYDGTVDVTLTQQCLSAAGRAYADLVEFSPEGQMLSTVSFIINIQASPDVMGSEAISSDDFLFFKQTIDKWNRTVAEAQEWANGYNGSTALPTSSGISVPGSDNNAKYWSEQAHVEQQKIENMTASAQAIDTGMQPTVTPSTIDGKLNLHFQIPIARADYVTFDVNHETGQLIMFRPDIYSLPSELDWAVNSTTGQLEVMFNDGQ